jgi:hypothetical protein
MRFTKSAAFLIAVFAAASVPSTLSRVTASPGQSTDQMAGMVHDAEGGNGADLGPDCSRPPIATPTAPSRAPSSRPRLISGSPTQPPGRTPPRKRSS